MSNLKIEDMGSQDRGFSRTSEARRRVALWTGEVLESSRIKEKSSVFTILREIVIFPYKTHENAFLERWEPKGT